jgi:hypothetical protein
MVLNITTTPHISQAVTWRTVKNAGSPAAQILRLTELLNPDSVPKTIPALTARVNIDSENQVLHHSVVFESLLPDTLYAYRVGSDGQWSEWNRFRTASDRPEPFTFLYFGDIQKQVFSICSQTIRSAFQNEPGAKFWLFAGDMVNNGPDDPEWAEFFSALGWISRTVPLAPVPGNHEYPDPRKVSPEDRRMTPLWHAHFTLPENGPEGLEETAYSFNYQGGCFIILNGNERIEEQAGWMEGILSANRLPWIIVAVHQPVYSISERRDRKQFQEIFVPLFDRYSVDLVLQGHDHGYARTLSLKNHQPVSAREKGTVYVISNSGPKFYPVSRRYEHLMAKMMSDHIWVQSIRLDGPDLYFSAFDMMYETVDEFIISKNIPR